MQRRIRELRNNQSGFTLIELLIVIVILGVLAAIVVFAVSAFNKNGQNAACKADFKNVEIADEAYFAKNQVYATSFTAGGPGAFVPNYLKEAPSINPNYTINIGTTTTGPTVTVNNAAGVPVTTADSSACANLSS